MKHPRSLKLALAALGLAPLAAWAGPVGGQVASGTASIRTNGVQTDIVQTSPRAVIDWRQFNIGAGESVHFRQPDASSSTLNRVTGADPSAIFGTMTATGQVLLLNPNGVLFGPNARVDTAGLIVSTAKLGTEDFMTGRLTFTPSDRAGGSIVNQGTITVREGGLAVFVAPHVRNDGLIQADLGRVMLASGSSFVVDLAGDGLVSLAVREADLQGLMDVQGQPAAALLENTGAVVARSGKVLIMTPAFASQLVDKAINLGGVVRADTVRQDKTGAIVLSSVNGQVNVTGEVAAPGGSLAIRRDADLLNVEGSTAEAISRVLRSGTAVQVETTGQLDVASTIDGRGGEAGAALQLTGASIGILKDIYTSNGSVTASAQSGAVLMVSRAVSGEDKPVWPVIATGGGDIHLSAAQNVQASHLITRGDVVIESAAGNVLVETNLGADLDGTSPLNSLTIRALGKPDSDTVGNVSKLWDVNVVAGGRIDISASRHIQIYAPSPRRPGLIAARNGLEGRSLRLTSDRLGSGDLTSDAYYWGGTRVIPHSRTRYLDAGSSPVDANGRWTDLSLATPDFNLPSSDPPPGPRNVLAAIEFSGNGLGYRITQVAQEVLPDVLPGASTVVPMVAGEAVPESTALIAADEGYSASRGVAQLADTGRVRNTSAPKDIFSLAEHVVEVPDCSTQSSFGSGYFIRGSFGQQLNVTCRR